MMEQVAEEHAIQDNSVAHALVDDHHADFKSPRTVNSGSNIFEVGQQAGASHAVTVSLVPK